MSTASIGYMDENYEAQIIFVDPSDSNSISVPLNSLIGVRFGTMKSIQTNDNLERLALILYKLIGDNWNIEIFIKRR